MKLQPQTCLVITNCTNRKRSGSRGPVVKFPDARAKSLEEAARRWTRQLASARSELPVRDLYVGTAFSRTRAVCEHLNAQLYVVSAGLGFVHGDALAPNYNASTSDRRSSLSQVLASLGRLPEDWWAALGRHHGTESPLASLVAQPRWQRILIAMPASYLELVARDLEGLTKEHANRLRIFTSPRGERVVPQHLVHAVMPYDERLQGSSRPGTQGDFPQRAMTHFVFDLDGTHLPLLKARACVINALSSCSAQTIPPREKRTDAELLEILRANWSKCEGRSTHLLRYLRDEALVACEQGRFRRLWLSLQSKMT